MPLLVQVSVSKNPSKPFKTFQFFSILFSSLGISFRLGTRTNRSTLWLTGGRPRFWGPTDRAARSTSWPRWLPTSSRRCRWFSLSANPPASLAAAPSRILPGARLRPSAAAFVRSLRGPASARPVRSAETAASTANPPHAKRWLEGDGRTFASIKEERFSTDARCAGSEKA